MRAAAGNPAGVRGSSGGGSDCRECRCLERDELGEDLEEETRWWDVYFDPTENGRNNKLMNSMQCRIFWVFLLILTSRCFRRRTNWDFFLELFRSCHYFFLMWLL